jgi:hypothetical protein
MKTATILAFIAGTQDLDTGQFLTYLFILFLPFITLFLIHQVIPHDPIEFKILQQAVIQGQPWALRGTRRPLSRKKVKLYKMPSVSMVRREVKTSNILRTYLIPLAMAAFQVGCRVECFFRQLSHLGRPPNCFAAMAGKARAHLDLTLSKSQTNWGTYLLPTPLPSKLNAGGPSPLIRCLLQKTTTIHLSLPLTTKPN